MTIKTKDYDLGNGFDIWCVTGMDNLGIYYYIGIHNDELEAKEAGCKVDDLPFWSAREEFKFRDVKEANEQFLISKDYYSHL